MCETICPLLSHMNGLDLSLCCNCQPSSMHNTRISTSNQCTIGAVVVVIVWYISVYNHYSSEFESRSWRGVLDTALREKVCQWLAAGRGFLRVLRFPPPIKLTSMM